jgi:large subunit ribosomal protein L44e
MVKIPARMRSYCPKCKKHTTMTVRRERTGRRGSGLVKGTRNANRHTSGSGNKGKYSKRAVSQTKMASKTSKKVDLRLTCTECKASWIRSNPRARRVELIKSL